jgi:hypothetical protein
MVCVYTDDWALFRSRSDIIASSARPFTWRYAMDIQTLAAQLAPLLPYLLKGGIELAKSAAGELGENSTTPLSPTPLGAIEPVEKFYALPYFQPRGGRTTARSCPTKRRRRIT